MQEIKCPECGKVFQVDESGYAAIVKQVRDKEFSKEIKEREAQFQAANETALNLAKVQASSDLKEQLAKKDAVINELNEKHSSEIAKADLEIAKLNEKLQAQENVSKSAIKNAEAEKDKEIIKLSEDEAKKILYAPAMEKKETIDYLVKETGWTRKEAMDAIGVSTYED